LEKETIREDPNGGDKRSQERREWNYTIVVKEEEYFD
jgi:hypothetical protein